MTSSAESKFTKEESLTLEKNQRLLQLRRIALDLSISRNKSYQALCISKSETADDSSYNIEEVLKEADAYYEWLFKNV